MSARPMTKSVAKKANWAATNELDKAAKALALREGIAIVEAYQRAATMGFEPNPYIAMARAIKTMADEDSAGAQDRDAALKEQR